MSNAWDVVSQEPSTTPASVSPPAPSADAWNVVAQEPASDAGAQPNLFQEAGQGFSRGSAELGLGAYTLAHSLGLVDTPTFAREAASATQRIRAMPQSEAVTKAQDAGLSRLVDPHYLASQIGAMVPGVGAIIGTSALGGLAAGAMTGGLAAPIGSLIGLGIGAGAQDFGTSYMNYLSQKGVDVADERALSVALSDPNLVNEATWFAAKRAGMTGALNALGGALAGKVAGRFFTPEATFAQKVAGGGAVAATGAASMTGAEAGAELASTGTVDPSRLTETAALGLIAGAPTMAIPAVHGVLRGRRAAETAPGAESAPPTVERAQATGPHNGAAETIPPEPIRAPPTITLDETGTPVRATVERPAMAFADPNASGAARIADAVLREPKRVAKVDEWTAIAQREAENAAQAADVVRRISELPKSKAGTVERDAVLGALRPEFIGVEEIRAAADGGEAPMPKSGMYDIALTRPNGERVRVGLDQSIGKDNARTLTLTPERALAPDEVQRAVAYARERGFQRLQIADTAARFSAMANAQRGDAEAAMLRVQFANGGGVLNGVVEHSGDLLHRVGEGTRFGWTEAYRNFNDKVLRVYRALTHSYGFEREHRENVLANGREAAKITAALKVFAAEHAKLPAYNPLHRLINDANIAIGNKDWTRARSLYSQLKKIADDPTAFETAASMDEGLQSIAVPRVDTPTLRENAAALRALDSAHGVEAVPVSDATSQIRETLNSPKGVFKGRPPKGASGMLAIADWSYRGFLYMLSIPQLAKTYPHIRDLVLYNEKIHLGDIFQANRINEIVPTQKAMLRLRTEQHKALGDMLHAYDQGMFLTELERERGVTRLPTPAEVAKLAAEAKAAPETIAIFEQIRKDYRNFLTHVQIMLVQQAKRLPAERQAAELVRVDELMRALAEKPYVPHLRFGKYAVTVRDGKGSTLAFATGANAAEQAQIRAALAKAYPLHTDNISMSVLSDAQLEIRGMPRPLLDSLASKLDLAPEQIELLRDLKYETAPIQSFAHRLQRRSNVYGFSEDYARVYAAYFMSGANFLKKAMFADELRDHVKSVAKQAGFMPNGNQYSHIANEMTKHLQYWLTPASELQKVKALGFLWALGFNPKSAITNLTSLPLLSYPHLARGFSNDARAVTELLRAGADWKTYYTKAKLEQLSSFESRALNELYNEATITEALAPMIAGVAEGRNLIEKFAGNPAQRGFQWFMEKAAWPFQMTEQMNRRITALAALRMAMWKPGARAVREAMQVHPLQYQRLIDRGYTPTEAAAITTAKHVVEVTQGIYKKSARAPFMRGKKSAIFQFKSFQQNTLWSMWNYPSAGMRSMLMFGALAGAVGLPLASDLNDIIKTIAWKAFGKDFDVEREARQFIIDTLHQSPLIGDWAMHGASRFGFGIPALLELAGMHSFSVDASSSTALGPISPVSPWLLFGPTHDPNAAFTQASQRMAGVGLGLGVAFYKLLTDPGNEQNWLNLIPRELANVSKAYSAYQNKSVQRADGSTIVQLDPTNAEDMAQIIAMSIGYSPTKVAQMQEMERAQYEVETLYDVRRQILMKQFSEAMRSADAEDRTRMLGAIRKFNAELPDAFKGKRITSDSLRSSVKATQTRIEKRSAGIPTKSNVGVAREIGRLYPGSEVLSEKRVR